MEVVHPKHRDMNGLSCPEKMPMPSLLLPRSVPSFRKRRCPMVEIIGFGTMVALVWLLAWSMASESESEKRRLGSSAAGSHHAEIIAQGTRARHAA